MRTVKAKASESMKFPGIPSYTRSGAIRYGMMSEKSTMKEMRIIMASICSLQSVRMQSCMTWPDVESP